MTAGRHALLPFALLFCVLPGLAAGQDADGGAARLRGVVFDSTAMTPLEGATVVVLGTSVRGASGADGSFLLEGIPPGAHSVSFFHRRLQALGVSAPVESVDFRAGQTAEIALALPSEKTLLDAWCLAEASGPDVSRLAGVVRDTLTGVAIPRAVVTLLPIDPETGVQRGVPVEQKTDDTGYYRFCDAPAGPVALQPHFGLSSGLEVTVELSHDRPTLQDLQIVLSSVGQLQGRVTDYATGEPVAGATVDLAGSDVRGTTDATGRFLLDSIPPGRHVLRTAFLGYESRDDSVTVFSNEAVGVDIRLTTEAIPIEGLVVTARGRLGERLVDVGRRLDFLGRAEIDELLPRVRDMQDLLEAANFPSLDVREVRLADPITGAIMQGVCIEALRMKRGSGCAMVTVVLDGVPLPSPADRLSTLNPETIESVRFLGPMEGTTRWGRLGASGVLEITTRR